MSNPFKPSSKHDPLVLNFDPVAYHNLGKDAAGKDIGFGTDQYLMSRSNLWKFSQCPSKFAARVPQQATPSLDWGSLLDVLYMTPEAFNSQYIVTPAEYEAPESRKKNAPVVTKEWNPRTAFCKAWKEEREESGLIVIDFQTYKEALFAIFRLRQLPDVQEFRDLCNTSVRICVEYHDKETGMVIQLKSLTDLAPKAGSIYGKALGDLKTAKSAAGPAWRRHLFKYGYHYQAALYLDAWNAVTGEDRTDFNHIVSENTLPFEPAQRFLSAEFLQIGRDRYQRDLAFYCQCVKVNKWPGYTHEAATRIVAPGGWHMVEPEPWMLQQDYDQSFVIPGDDKPKSSGLALPPPDDDEDENIP